METKKKEITACTEVQNDVLDMLLGNMYKSNGYGITRECAQKIADNVMAYTHHHNPLAIETNIIGLLLGTAPIIEQGSIWAIEQSLPLPEQTKKCKNVFRVLKHYIVSATMEIQYIGYIQEETFIHKVGIIEFVSTSMMELAESFTLSEANSTTLMCSCSTMVNKLAFVKLLKEVLNCTLKRGKDIADVIYDDPDNAYPIIMSNADVIAFIDAATAIGVIVEEQHPTVLGEQMLPLEMKETE